MWTSLITVHMANVLLQLRSANIVFSFGKMGLVNFHCFIDTANFPQVFFK